MAVRKAGRPRKYETPEAFDAAVDAYCAERKAAAEPVTWTGMALALGFTSRDAIDTYAKYEGFSYSVKRAKLLVEASYESRLFGNSAAGPIFALKNMGWSDKQELEHSGNVTVEIARFADTPAE